MNFSMQKWGILNTLFSILNFSDTISMWFQQPTKFRMYIRGCFKIASLEKANFKMGDLSKFTSGLKITYLLWWQTPPQDRNTKLQLDLILNLHIPDRFQLELRNPPLWCSVGHFSREQELFCFCQFDKSIHNNFLQSFENTSSSNFSRYNFEKK